MSFGNAWGNSLLNQLRLYPDGAERTLYLALHSSDPGPADSTTTELSGGSYARKLVTFAPPASKMMATNSPVVWSGLRTATIGYIALWDSLTAGHIVAYGAMTPVSVGNGGSFTLGIAEFTVTI